MLNVSKKAKDRKRLGVIITIIVVFAVALVAAAFVMLCRKSRNTGPDTTQYEYGVFLGAEPEDMEYMKKYKIIVLEGQSFSKQQIEELKSEGHTVYSYINVGALENYRPYYKDYEKYTLDVYENWEDERWVDVSQKEWQEFITADIAKSLVDKGVDGLFVDNLDVYYHYQNEGVFEGITYILKTFKEYGMYVSINGGDVYVTEYLNRYNTLDVIDAVNQETVFSKILWDGDKFSTQEKSEREYFQEYLSNVKSAGKDVYLLEYTTDKKLIREINEYCKEKGYRYYASPKLNLDATDQQP